MPPTSPVPELPLRITPDGQLATVEQYSTIDSVQRVAVMCHTSPGWSQALPGFGLADQTFLRGGPDVGYIEAQINEYVPEANALVAAADTRLNPHLARIGVQVS